MNPSVRTFLAALLLSAASPAMAADSKAVLYGQACLSLDIINAGRSSTAQEIHNLRISSNASRIGIRGEENLGGGFGAIWQIESKLHMDSGDGDLGMRNTFAGVTSATWGQLLLGRHDTPYKTASRRLHIFGDTIGSSHALMGGTVKGSNSALAFSARKGNLLMYSSPAWSTVTVHVARSAEAELLNAPATITGHSQSLSAIYDREPWYAILGYQANFIGSDAGRAGATTSDTAAAKESAWTLGAGYESGRFEIDLAYEQTRDNINRAESVYTCTSVSTSADCYGHHAWLLAAEYKLGQSAVKLAQIRSGNLGGGTVKSSGACQWIAGYSHHLGKRTSLQITYSKLFNNEHAAYGIGSSEGGGIITALGAGADPSAWSFGMKHTF